MYSAGKRDATVKTPRAANKRNRTINKRERPVEVKTAAVISFLDLVSMGKAKDFCRVTRACRLSMKQNVKGASWSETVSRIPFDEQQGRCFSSPRREWPCGPMASRYYGTDRGDESSWRSVIWSPEEQSGLTADRFAFFRSPTTSLTTHLKRARCFTFLRTGCPLEPF